MNICPQFYSLDDLYKILGDSTDKNQEETSPRIYVVI